MSVITSAVGIHLEVYFICFCVWLYPFHCNSCTIFYILCTLCKSLWSCYNKFCIFLVRIIVFPFSTFLLHPSCTRRFSSPFFSHLHHQRTRTLKATPLERRSFGYSFPSFHHLDSTLWKPELAMELRCRLGYVKFSLVELYCICQSLGKTWICTWRGSMTPWLLRPSRRGNARWCCLHDMLEDAASSWRTCLSLSFTN